MIGRIRVRRPSPALVLSAVALFFAIGGSAFAVGQRLGVAQPKCANGAVKGFAYVKGDPNKGIQNLPEEYVSDPKVFGTSFNCSGKPVQVKRAGTVFQIRFPGTVGRLAIVTGAGPDAGQFWATPLPDGSWRITRQGPPGAQDLGPQSQFLIVLF
jgi:hypothetical protein